MRKNAVRKWLHAILDLLPLFVIPIFAINIINRSPEPLTVEYDTTETETVVNYKYQSNVVNSLDDLVEGNLYFSNELEFDALNDEEYSFVISVVSFDNISFNDIDNEYNEILSFMSEATIINVNVDVLSDVYFDIVLSDNSYISYNVHDYLDLSNVNYFIQNGALNGFKDWFNVFGNDDISSSTYNVIESVETITTGTVVTYDDTDIGSQFVYSMYHTVNTYFNFGNIFGMTGIYNWFVTNFFNGNAPLVVPIIWNIIVYEFIMDILFIIYHLFMMLIDFTDYLLDKPFDSVKRKR